MTKDNQDFEHIEKFSSQAIQLWDDSKRQQPVKQCPGNPYQHKPCETWKGQKLKDILAWTFVSQTWDRLNADLY